MKISRHRKVRKYMGFFRNNYGFRLPYQVLIDATFCAAAKKHKVNISEQLPRYLNGPVKLLTTQCVILEAEKFGKDLYGALVIVKQYSHHKCGHEGKPVPAFQCLEGMLGVKNANRYIIATQDRELQKVASLIPGVPVLYLYEQTPTLQPPSETSTRMARLSCRERFEVNAIQEEALIGHKKLLGVEVATIQEEKKKKKKIRGPNPLSCKKKKKSQQQNQSNCPGTDGAVHKRKRKRIKIPQHVKEHFRETLSSIHA